MTQTPLERATAAIRYTIAHDRYGEVENPDEVARAVLMAIREPSDAMMNRGEMAWMNRNLADPKSEPMRDCFQAMIDEALDEKTI